VYLTRTKATDEQHKTKRDDAECAHDTTHTRAPPSACLKT